jgi:nucleotide-binding universal stress UspA family protein
VTIPRCLVSGVDASPESLAALELALELADRLGARLVVVHAVGLLEEGGYRPRPDLGAIVADARQRVGAGGAVVDPVYEDGPPPDVLLRVAEREAAELLVVGSRGVSGARRQLGSTSEAVVMSSRIPVLVVP